MFNFATLTKSNLLILLSQPLLLCLITSLVFAFHNSAHLNDVGLYHEYAVKLLQGKIPYRDFSFEYPPVALIPIVLPQLFNFTQGLTSYTVLFFVEIVIFSWLITQGLNELQPEPSIIQEVLGSKSEVRTGIQPLDWGFKQNYFWLKRYTIIVIILAPLLPWRYDLFPALLTFFTLIFVQKKQPIFAGILLALGVGAKLYPLVLLPVLCLYYLVLKQYSALSKFLLSNFGTSFIIGLSFWLLAGSKLLSFVQYHRLRGLQLESLPAGLLLLATNFSWLKVDLIYNYGAVHIGSPLADMIAAIFPYICIILFCLAMVICYLSFHREYLINKTICLGSLVTFINVAILIFIVANKVLSPQYIIWLIPFIPLLSLRQVYLFLGIACLTMIIFPFTYKELNGIQFFPVLILNIRNIGLITLLDSLLKDTYLKRKKIRISAFDN